MNAEKFVTESNMIEGILRPPTAAELNEFHRFMDLDAVNVNEMEAFVKVYQPDARLRDKAGLNVRVGNHYPPLGGPRIRHALAEILDKNENPFATHLAYESLHPFTDGNGRSGRMLWAWQMRENQSGLSFLHLFYYQTLSYCGRMPTNYHIDPNHAPECLSQASGSSGDCDCEGKDVEGPVTKQME